MYRIEYEISLEKTLKKIPKKDVQSILKKIESLAQDPRPRWSEKLKERSGYRIAVGNYRILYQVDEKKVQIIIIDIDDRKDVYKVR